MEVVKGDIDLTFCGRTSVESNRPAKLAACVLGAHEAPKLATAADAIFCLASFSLSRKSKACTKSTRALRDKNEKKHVDQLSA